MALLGPDGKPLQKGAGSLVTDSGEVKKAMQKLGMPGGVEQLESGLVVPEDPNKYRIPSDRAPSVVSAEEVVRYLVIGHAYNPESMNMFAEKAGRHPCDAIIIFGVADTKYHIEDMLKILGRTGKLVYAMPGSHELVPDWKESVEAARRKHENIVDMAAHSPFVVSKDHNLLFIPGSFNLTSQSGYYVVTDKGAKTHSRDDPERGEIRFNSMEEHMGYVTPVTGLKTLVIAHDAPRFNGEEGVDYTPAADVYSKEGDEIEFSRVTLQRAKFLENMGRKVVYVDENDHQLYGNTGNEDFARELRASGIMHLVTAGNSGKSLRSCDREGQKEIPNDQWKSERFLNLGTFAGGNYATLEVRAAPNLTGKRDVVPGIETRVIEHHVCD
jgi:hypothetical protein